MTSIVMILDVVHFHSAAHAANLVYVFDVVEQIWVFSYKLLVAFEVNSIYLYTNQSKTDHDNS